MDTQINLVHPRMFGKLMTNTEQKKHKKCNNYVRQRNFKPIGGV